jgi:hypothetical protein
VEPDDNVFPDFTYVIFAPVKFVPDKLTFVKSKPERSAPVKFMFGPKIYPPVRPYPVGSVGATVSVTPDIVAVDEMPPLVIPERLEFVKFTPVKFVLARD